MHKVWFGNFFPFPFPANSLQFLLSSKYQPQLGTITFSLLSEKVQSWKVSGNKGRVLLASPRQRSCCLLCRRPDTWGFTLQGRALALSSGACLIRYWENSMLTPENAYGLREQSWISCIYRSIYETNKNCFALRNEKPWRFITEKVQIE